jgi:hypothetical protein
LRRFLDLAEDEARNRRGFRHRLDVHAVRG